MHPKRSSPGSPERRPPSSSAWRYSIPAAARFSSSGSRLNCGLRRELREPADVDERPHGRLVQAGNKLGEGSRTVSDGEQPHRGIRSRLPWQGGSIGGCHHLEPAEGARRFPRGERLCDQPLPRARSVHARDDARRVDEDQLAARRGAEVRLAERSRAHARPEAGASRGLRPDPRLPRERVRPERRARRRASSQPGSTRSGA